MTNVDYLLEQISPGNMKILVATLCLFSTYCFAQTKLPALDIIPQEPTTASFSRYGDIPVDLSTGVPKIEIPLYTLKTGDITIPLSISYHASGIKVKDVSSEIGLGWVINSGGIITRSVLGREDELLFLKPTPPNYTYPINKPAYKDSLRLAQDISNALKSSQYEIFSHIMFDEIQLRSNYDCYADRYYYNLGNGESGVFRRNYIDNELIVIPYSPTKPKINDDTHEIEMTTSDGNHYHFKWNYLDIWYLSKIVSNNKTDSVLFYSHIETYSKSSSNDIGVTGGTRAYLRSDNVCGAILTQQPADSRKEIIYISPPSRMEPIVVFDSIVCAVASVKFLYQRDRQDCQYEVNAPKSRLQKMQVFSKPMRNLVKEISFFQSYFGSSKYSYRLRLDSLQVGTSEKEKYAFKYNTTQLPDYPDAVRGTTPDPTVTQSYQEDFWGYYNISGGQTSLPWPYFPNGVRKTPTPGFMNACSLEEVRFPTGGRTIFEFEPHQVTPVANGITTPEGYIGGLRVKKISTYANDKDKPLIKQYQYERIYATFDSFDLFNYTQHEINTYIVSMSHGCNFLEYTTSTITLSSPIQPFIGDSNNPIIYPTVTEIIGDMEAIHGKTIYSFETPPKKPYIEFEAAENDYLYQHKFQFDRGIYHSVLVGKTEYKYEDGQYRKLRTTLNTITNYRSGRIQTGINLASTHTYRNFLPDGNESGAFGYYLYLKPTEYLSSLVYSNTWAYTDVRLPSKTDVYEYIDDNTYIKTSSLFTYNDILQLSGVSTITSSGGISNTTMKYPYDFKQIEPYKTMTERNNLNPIIEQTNYIDSNVQRGMKTNYQTWSPITIAPVVVDEKTGSADYETRIRFNNYDERGNVISVTNDKGLTKRYIWGYNKTHPIAELIGPDTQSTFAYSSFEDIQSNNPKTWVINGTYKPVTDLSAPTGTKCFNLTLGNLSINELSPSTTYILSYWYKGSPPTLSNGIVSDVVIDPPLEGWTHVTQKLKGANSLQISGTGYLDEARLHPAGSTMVTYTYSPLVGITSSTDQNGITTYYEYDSLNRLKSIKDNRRNVIQNYNYNYKK